MGDSAEGYGGSGKNILFGYNRNCIWCIDGKCLDLPSHGHGRKCDGNEKCRLPWRDTGWITYNVKMGEK